MTDDNVVIMDGPGPFFFGRLEGPIEILAAPHADAIAIQGQIEVDETGRRVVVHIPLADEDALNLLQLLEDYREAKSLPKPE